MIKKPTYEELEQRCREFEEEAVKHKQIEEALRYFQQAVDSSSDAIGMSTPDGKHYYQNVAFTNLFGLYTEEVDGEEGPPSTVYMDERIGREVFGTIMQGDDWNGEVEMLDKKGNKLDILLRAYSIKDEEGKVAGLVGVHTDISSRKQAENEIKKARDDYHIITTLIADIIVQVDAEGCFTFLNDHACTFWGYPREKMIGTSFYDYMHPDDRERSSDVIQKAIMEKREDRGLINRQKTKEGYKTIEWSGAPFFNSDKQHIGFQASGRDITERKRLEEELLRAQKLESVGVLAGGIAHDFNNILTTILGNVTLARMRVRSEDEVFELLREAETASIRAQTLTKQLLTFAKGGAPVKETASVKDILKESSAFVLRGSKSRCEFSIPGDLWPAEVDAGQISQVVNNIVINANQAMPEGGDIQIAAENLIIEDSHGLPVKPGRYIKVSIKDQGAGIAENHLLNIFDPYFTTKQEGSGLGLATTFSIIKKHDGHITVESQLGVGTTFHIYLPASEKAVPEKEEDRLITGQGRILIMDDDVSLGRMLGRMLGKLGYESESAKDGAEAIDMYKAAKESGKPYDVVIMDLTIPGGMGGKEAIAKLLEIYPEAKAIVYSGYSDDPVLANFQEYGFKGMMLKPFEPQSLGKVLHEVLQSEKE